MTPNRPSRPNVADGRFGARSGFALTAFQHFTNPILVMVTNGTPYDLPEPKQAVAMGFAILTNGEFGFMVKHPTEPGVLEYVPSNLVEWPPVLATREIGSSTETVGPNREQRRHGRN
jgi:hypothetical protein